MNDWTVFITSDLPIAPAEDAFKQAARRLNSIFLEKIGASDISAKVFIVLREFRGRGGNHIKIGWHPDKKTIGINLPLRVDVFCPGTNTVAASLVASLRVALVEACAYAQREGTSINVEPIYDALDALDNESHA